MLVIPVVARLRGPPTVEAKMACAVVGDSGVVALLLLGPFKALPACASSTRLETCRVIITHAGDEVT